MKKIILSIILSVIVFTTCSFTVVSAEKVTILAITIDTQNINVDEVASIKLKNGAEEINIDISKERDWKSFNSVKPNKYDVIISFGGKKLDYELVSSVTGKPVTTITIKEGNNELKLKLVKKTILNENNGGDLKAEGLALLEEFEKVFKPVAESEEFKAFCEKKYGSNDPEESSFCKDFLECYETNTIEMWNAMDNVQKYKYDNFVIKTKDKIAGKNAYTSKITYLSNSNYYSYTDPFVVGKEVYKNNQKISDILKAEGNICSWLWDTYEETGVFVNLYDIDGTMPVVAEPEQTVTDDITENETDVDKTSVAEKAPAEVKSDNAFIKILKKSWFTLLILVLAGSAFLVVRTIRKNKGIDDN